jgi:prevent-host-death family protein
MTAEINQHREPESGSWTVTRAKAHFNEVIDRARTEGPQKITRNGRLEAVVVAPEEWQQRTQPAGTLADFFANSPLRDVPDLVIARQPDHAGNLNL